MDIFASSIFSRETGITYRIRRPDAIIVCQSPDPVIFLERVMPLVYDAQLICLTRPTPDDEIDTFDLQHLMNWSLLADELVPWLVNVPAPTLSLDFILRASAAGFAKISPAWEEEEDVWETFPLRKDLPDERPLWQKTNTPRLSPRRAMGLQFFKGRGII